MVEPLVEPLSKYNILDLYMHAAGDSEIPYEWHEWCCLSLIASAVSDRVYYKKFIWENMAPNMYIFMVGPSGCGKGGALGYMGKFIHPRMNMYKGSTTYKSMIDKMSAPAEAGGVTKSKMLLVQQELSSCIGSGALADAMVKAMTDWYTPTNDDYQESTRMHGERSFPPPCINWLAGTTVEWLKQSVDTEAMLSGFFGRVAISPGEYDENKRIHDPTQHCPDDYDEVVEEIKDRIEWLTQLEGQFDITAEAYDADKIWYEKRKSPSPEMLPFWRRQHDLTLKIAMILSLSDDMKLTIKLRHILRAQELTEQSARILPKVITMAGHTEFSRSVEKTKDLIKKYSTITHKVLLNRSKNWNANAEIVKKIIHQLLEEGCIVRNYNKKGGAVYNWIGESRQLYMPD